MAKIFKILLKRNAGLYVMYGLAFFLLTGCTTKTQQVTVNWSDHRARNIKIPLGLLKTSSDTDLKVTLTDKPAAKGILGDFAAADNAITFTPLIPLSAGLTYFIFEGDKLVGSVAVPLNNGEPAPKLTSFYPTIDTLPENQLKLYLQFSKSMRTGNSLEHVCLLDKNKDTMRNVFLNLQPELWDSTGTVLTLWLDPGRIKRGLVLNQKLGNPLKKTENYQLVVASDWKDTHGTALGKTYTRNFIVNARDEEIPDINKWQLISPKAGTTQPFVIKTNETLDHYLLQESISILDINGKPVKGIIALRNDKTWTFTPALPWKTQTYRIHALARLEDLAGNNLNRVFDRDLRKDKQDNKEFFERGFTVQ